MTEDLSALLRLPSVGYLATAMPDGSPQVTQTWLDTDGEHVLINSVRTHVKTRNANATIVSTITLRPRIAGR